MRLAVGRGIALWLMACAATTPWAAEKAAPLTLQQALEAADRGHPEWEIAEAEREAAAAELALARSQRDPTVHFEGILRSGRPTTNDRTFTSDNSARLTARKNLYDFGRTAAAEEAGRAEVQARELALLDTRARRRIEIMTRFFDVLIADAQFTADNEFMAVAYVSLDQGRDRLEAGKISRVDLAEIEARYQDTFVRRTASLQRQRIARALLANSLNRPDDLPSILAEPVLDVNNRTLPDYDGLQQQLLSANPRLKAQQEMLAAARSRLEGARAENRPRLDAEVEAADYSRSSATRDDLRAGLILNWPLYQGGRVDARIAREQANFHRLQASTEKLRRDLTQALLETYLEISQLQSAGRSAAEKQVVFRDLKLERARGEYELELKTNLGTSMAETVEANLRARKVEYQLALAFARLDALLGRLPYDADAAKASEPAPTPVASSSNTERK